MLDTSDAAAILKDLAQHGRLSKTRLAELLSDDAATIFLDRCREIEKQFTEACSGKHDPCLDSGCAMEDDICLSALLDDETEYQKSCGAVWLTLFEQPENRLGVWRR